MGRRCRESGLSACRPWSFPAIWRGRAAGATPAPEKGRQLLRRVAFPEANGRRNRDWMCLGVIRIEQKRS